MKTTAEFWEDLTRRNRRRERLARLAVYAIVAAVVVALFYFGSN